MQYTRDLGTPISIIKIVVWYADGSKQVATTPEEWAQLSDESVQVVQVLYELVRKGRYLQDVIAGEDYYWYHAGHYYGGNGRQVPQEAQHIKAGSWVSDDQYWNLYNEALEGVAP